MKFIISSATLLKGLQNISGIMSSNLALPILDDFLFELSPDNQLTLTATDLETTISVKINVDMSEESGQIAIPAKILLEIMKTLPDLPVTFEINNENQQVELLAGEGKYKLIGHKSDEFPQIPEIEEPQKLELNADLLLNAFNKTIFATGNDETRPVMSGVFCEIKNDHISFVATDAHKLVRYRRHDIKSEIDEGIILPRKPLNHLRGILPNDEDVKVDFEFNAKYALMKFENTTVVCRLIEGKYPKYEAVIPSSNPYKLTVDRKSLLNSLRRVSIFGSKSTHLVRFKISGQELVISAEDIDYLSEGKERLSCNYEGDDMEIGFNARFMQEMLNNLDSENIDIELSQPNRAGIIHPEGNSNEGEDILMLLMPLMLSQN
jgi:DNA polymerase-3 subunit beta